MTAQAPPSPPTPVTPRVVGSRVLDGEHVVVDMQTFSLTAGAEIVVGTDETLVSSAVDVRATAIACHTRVQGTLLLLLWLLRSLSWLLPFLSFTLFSRWLLCVPFSWLGLWLSLCVGGRLKLVSCCPYPRVAGEAEGRLPVVPLVAMRFWGRERSRRDIHDGRRNSNRMCLTLHMEFEHRSIKLIESIRQFFIRTDDHSIAIRVCTEDKERMTRSNV